MLLSVARQYAEAAARYQRSLRSQRPHHLARIRFLEVSAALDKILTDLVLRTGPKRRTIITATDAALIKSAARRLADRLHESHLGPTYSPQAAYEQLTHRIYETLSTREAEDNPATAHITDFHHADQTALAA